MVDPSEQVKALYSSCSRTNSHELAMRIDDCSQRSSCTFDGNEGRRYEMNCNEISTTNSMLFEHTCSTRSLCGSSQLCLLDLCSIRGNINLAVRDLLFS